MYSTCVCCASSNQGFNFEGKELFWTVAGETVGALAFVNFVKQDERYVGSA
jgi:hypothetical protein